MKKFIALTAIAGLALTVSPVFASGGEIVITNDNSAIITNEIGAHASTGQNISYGGTAANTTTGGNVHDSDYQNKAGNAGSTVLGGMGGSITTGKATAVAHAENVVNTNRTRVSADPWATEYIRVTNLNAVDVLNSLDGYANTESNTSSGSSAVNTVSGGDVYDAGASNTAGNGGSHVEAGNGGAIITGEASSHAYAVNVINRNVTRIRR